MPAETGARLGVISVRDEQRESGSRWRVERDRLGACGLSQPVHPSLTLVPPACSPDGAAPSTRGLRCRYGVVMGGEFSTTVTRAAGATVIAVSGEIDIATC